MKRFIMGLLVALTATLAPPAATVAFGSDPAPVWVGNQSETVVTSHPCLGNSTSTCTLTVTTSVPGHYVLPDPTGYVHPALACSGTYYVWPSMTATDTAGPYTLWTIRLSAENSYNYCSVGMVYVDLSCSGGFGISCGAASHGGFWDSGHGYYQDWGNQNVSSSLQTSTVYVRLHVNPNGTWSRWCYWSGGSC